MCKVTIFRRGSSQESVGEQQRATIRSVLSLSLSLKDAHVSREVVERCEAAMALHQVQAQNLKQGPVKHSKKM